MWPKDAFEHAIALNADPNVVWVALLCYMSAYTKTTKRESSTLAAPTDSEGISGSSRADTCGVVWRVVGVRVDCRIERHSVWMWDRRRPCDRHACCPAWARVVPQGHTTTDTLWDISPMRRRTPPSGSLSDASAGGGRCRRYATT